MGNLPLVSVGMVWGIVAVNHNVPHGPRRGIDDDEILDAIQVGQSFFEVSGIALQRDHRAACALL
jgi:hypothetical protein